MIYQTIKIYQIYYNEETKNQLDPVFIPLDNSRNDKSEWFEFFPIKSFLDKNELEDNTYYGFLSPRFFEKTQLTGKELIDILCHKVAEDNNIDVFLSNIGFGALAYYKNVFFQGEDWHPGLMSLTQQFLNKIGCYIDLNDLVSTTKTFAFCNYIIAKKDYWLAWKKLADQFYDFVENSQDPIANELRKNTKYKDGEASMRTFIQERFPAIILSHKNYRTDSFGKQYNDSEVLTKLKLCDKFKNRYLESYDPIDLLVYQKIKEDIDNK